jgi:hypothetical protein
MAYISELFLILQVSPISVSMNLKIQIISARKTSSTAMTDFMYQGTSEIERINAHPAEQCRAIWWQMDRSTGLSQKRRLFQNLKWQSARQEFAEFWDLTTTR